VPVGSSAAPGRDAHQEPSAEKGKHFFFEKKKQKTFDYFGFGSPGEAEADAASNKGLGPVRPCSLIQLLSNGR
jgi:hypothetical protein